MLKRFLSKKKTLTELAEEKWENEAELMESEAPKEEEWVWVEGYKGTDKDMKCRNFQFELEKTYEYHGDIELCESGFHFCYDLADVFKYYNIGTGKDRNKFFKVKCLVSIHSAREAINSNPERECFYFTAGNMLHDSKDVAKKIIFTEEVDFLDLEKHIKAKYPFIETKSQYTNTDDYHNFVQQRFREKFLSLGFSELYIEILLNKGANSVNYEGLYSVAKRAEAYHAEGINRDMMVYLLETQ